jgi:hypothetical protein
MGQVTVTEDGYDSADEGLEMLLGGMVLSDISLDAWTYQENKSIGIVAPAVVPFSASSAASNPSKSDIPKTTPNRKSHGICIDLKRLETQDGSTELLFARAHSMSMEGRFIGPSVQIVDLVRTWYMRTSFDVPPNC